ncbi:MAG: precorrin-6A/cobalt-precorrin-6A reductase, partial [Boseongicola sp.]|nr:precorrin-6A/cobalt-precorrin-6A reductase [Boseongicola sp.]
RVPDIPAAVDALDQKAIRVFLAVGRMHLADFAPNPQHHYVLRLVDPPKGDLPFPDAEVIVDRGPFQEADDLALLRSKRVDLVVSKNSGGTAAYAKIAAARTLQLPVLMIDRPVLPKRLELTQVPAVLDWVRQHDTDLGV